LQTGHSASAHGTATDLKRPANADEAAVDVRFASGWQKYGVGQFALLQADLQAARHQQLRCGA
jgi:hypothetical protein